VAPGDFQHAGQHPVFGREPRGAVSAVPLIASLEEIRTSGVANSDPLNPAAVLVCSSHSDIRMNRYRAGERQSSSGGAGRGGGFCAGSYVVRWAVNAWSFASWGSRFSHDFSANVRSGRCKTPEFCAVESSR